LLLDPQASRVLGMSACGCSESVYRVLVLS
jgi:hypothetical protein